MRKSIPLSCVVWIFFLLVVSERSIGQISFGLYGGYVQSTARHDIYALDRAWPSRSGPTNSYRWNFIDRGAGRSIMANVMWEATPNFGVAFIYRNMKLDMKENKRSLTSNSLGAQLKFNVIRNESRIVPFIQGEFYFSLSNTLYQENAVSLVSSDQVQPRVDKSFATHLGLGGDVGLEIKLTNRANLVVMGGYHGINLVDADDDVAFCKTLDYGNYWGPSDFDGGFFLQFSGGLKYYLGGKGR